MTLSEYLKISRKQAGYSQAEVAEELGYTSAQFISNWERGVSSPPLEVLYCLIKLYRLKPEKLIDLMLQESRRRIEDSIKSAKAAKTKGRRAGSR